MVVENVSPSSPVGTMGTFELWLYSAFLSNMATQRFLVMVNFRTLWTGEHRGDGRLAQGHPHLGAYYNIVLCFKLKMRLKLGGKAAGYLRHTQNAQTKKKNTHSQKKSNDGYNKTSNFKQLSGKHKKERK